MHLYKEHMRPVDELIDEARKDAEKTWDTEEFINRYIYQHLSYIIKDFQKFVTDLQEEVKPK